MRGILKFISGDAYISLRTTTSTLIEATLSTAGMQATVPGICVPTCGADPDYEKLTTTGTLSPGHALLFGELAWVHTVGVSE